MNKVKNKSLNAKLDLILQCGKISNEIFGTFKFLGGLR